MEDHLAALSDDAISVHTGFPNPALDNLHRSSSLDLNKLLIRHPSSTYMFVVHGHQWEGSGIFDGDIAIIDRALEPKSKDLIIGWQPSGFIACRHDQLGEQETYWGVIAAVIHKFNS